MRRKNNPFCVSRDPHPSLAGLSLPEKRQKITFIRLAVTLPTLTCLNKEFHFGGFSGGFPYKDPIGDGKEKEFADVMP